MSYEDARLPRTPHRGAVAAPAASGDSDPSTRTCRICLDEGDDEVLGRLIVPCRCTGTSRYVHEGCLLSWRSSIKADSFYACPQCGSKYRFRKTLVSSLLGRTYSAHILAIVISLALAILFGFFTSPLMRLTESEMLSFGDEQLPHRCFDEHLAVGDALRETASFTGFLFRDCNWSSAREPHWEQETTIAGDLTKASNAVLKIRDVEVRRNLTRCGLFWGKSSDDERPAQGVGLAILHVARGFSLFSLGRAFLGRSVRQYFLLAITLRMFAPSLGGKLPYNSFADMVSASWLGIDASFLADVIKMVRRRAKVARSEGQIASWWQFPLVMCTFLTAVFAFRSILSFSRRTVKAALARVESLVVDLAEEEGTVERKQA